MNPRNKLSKLNLERFVIIKVLKKRIFNDNEVIYKLKVTTFELQSILTSETEL